MTKKWSGTRSDSAETKRAASKKRRADPDERPDVETTNPVVEELDRCIRDLENPNFPTATISYRLVRFDRIPALANTDWLPDLHYALRAIPPGWFLWWLGERVKQIAVVGDRHDPQDPTRPWGASVMSRGGSGPLSCDASTPDRAVLGAALKAWQHIELGKGKKR